MTPIARKYLTKFESNKNPGYILCSDAENIMTIAFYEGQLSAEKYKPETGLKEAVTKKLEEFKRVFGL